MQLSELQSALGVLLLQPEGLGALESKDKWEAFCQNHDYLPLKSLSHERLSLYEELLFAGVESTLVSLFPFCRRLFKRQEWYDLVEYYRREYPNPSYQLYRCAEGFPAFIAKQSECLQRYPFLTELAEYEWQEVLLLNAKNPDLPANLASALPEGEAALSTLQPFWNPVSILLHFEYPIPAIITQIQSFEEAPTAFTVTPEATDVLLYREPDTCKVRFFQFNALTAVLFQVSKQEPNYQQVFETLQKTTPSLASIPLSTVISEGLKLMSHCYHEKLLLGSVPA